jgi:carbon storage regulator
MPTCAIFPFLAGRSLSSDGRSAFSQRDNNMHVFSRKKNESLVIGDHITLTVIEIRGDKVRLGIEHPGDASVHRGEVIEPIRAQAEMSVPAAGKE